MNKKIEIIAFYLAFFGFFFILLISQIPGMDNYVGSIFDNLSGNKTKVTGSSLDMRLNQLMGALDIIKYSIIQGQGFEWVQVYLSTHRIHPVCLAFESLILVILCNEGLLGFVYWAILIYMVSKKVPYKTRNQKNAVLCIFYTYIAYSCITGEYDYMRYMLIIYCLALMAPSIGKYEERSKKLRSIR